MDVLLTESAPGLADAAAGALRARGHRVFECHPVGGYGDLGCLAALDGGRCPLDTGGVDVVLDVRAPAPVFTTREAGVVCARRASTPLVIAALPASDRPNCPWALWCAPEDAVAATERLGAAGVDVVRALTASVRLALYRAAYDSRATVGIRYDDGELAVTVTTDRPVPAAAGAVRAAATAAVSAALPGVRLSGVELCSGRA